MGSPFWSRSEHAFFAAQVATLTSPLGKDAAAARTGVGVGVDPGTVLFSVIATKKKEPKTQAKPKQNERKGEAGGVVERVAPCRGSC